MISGRVFDTSAVETAITGRSLYARAMLAAARPPSEDLTASAVVLSARRRGWPVLTDRAPTLLALDAAIRTEPLP